MSYLDTLAENETVLLRARRTKLIFVDSVLYTLLWTAYVICFYAMDWMPNADSGVRAAVAFGPAIIPLFFFIRDLFSYIFLQVVITNTRILGKRGILSLTVLNIPLNRATDMKVNITVIGRIFKFGTITIFTPGGEFVYKKVANPIKIKSTANRVLIENSTPTGSPGVQGTGL
ncbi:MAG: PH domain-containing protein [Firmicutes bacterium]|nr:PH domain-containing protein [Bacillota bacterium]